MRGVFDFAVRWDEKTEPKEELTKRILYSIFLKQRVKANKPCVVFVSGGSGEGKSWSTLKIMQILCELQGYSYDEYKDLMNIFLPPQYPQKIEKILYDKQYKKINMLAVHESREVVPTANWTNFLSKAIPSINKLSRRIKPMAFFILSQFIRDISVDLRFTIDYYIQCSRPYGSKPRLRIYKMWVDERDISKPLLRKKRLKGYIVDPKGRWTFFMPKYLEVSKPDKELREWFEDEDFNSKINILKNKMDQTLKELESVMGVPTSKIDDAVEYYIKNSEVLMTIGKRRGKRFRVHKDFTKLHDFNKREIKEFEEKLTERIDKMGAGLE